MKELRFIKKMKRPLKKLAGIIILASLVGAFGLFLVKTIAGQLLLIFAAATALLVVIGLLIALAYRLLED